MRKVIFPIVSSVLLAGCAALPDLNASLAQINDNLRKANYSLRNASGGSKTVTAEAEDEVCDKQAFQSGFSDEYVRNWNLEVGNREATYRLLFKSHPDDAAARHNYELYKGQTFSTKGIGNGMTYGINMDGKGNIKNPCQSGSYIQGRTAGTRAVTNDLKVLSEQEIERRYE